MINSKINEQLLRSFLNKFDANDQSLRLAYVRLLYSTKQTDLRVPIIETVSQEEWETLILLTSNFLNTKSDLDWKRFCEYFNQFAE